MSKMIINLSERAVSADVNRLQTMLRTLLSESQRWMFGARVDEADAAGYAQITTTVTTPLTAHILNGILPTPGIGVSTITVTQGVLFVVDVDNPVDNDASGFKPIVDSGTVTPLTITPNASGFTRIDVVECQRNPNVVSETDTRDIFNGLTGVFNATNVDKVAADHLTYRIRSGVAGAGYPGNAAGWLPLMVCVVPNGFGSCDDCTFYDVRPLVSDLAHAPFDITDARYGVARMNAQALPNVYTDAGLKPTVMTVGGTLEANLFNRRLGGDLNPNLVVPAINLLDFFNVGDAAFNYPANSQGIWYLYFATFHGLPRWAKYTPASVGFRRPMSPRGVPVYTLIPPTAQGRPSSPITAPAGMFLNAATTTTAVMVMAGSYQTIGHAFAIVGGCMAHRGDILLTDTLTGAAVDTAGYHWFYPAVAPYPTATITNPFPGAANVFTFQLSDNATHPITASSIKLRIKVLNNFGGPVTILNGYIKVSVPDASDGSATHRPQWVKLIELGGGGAVQVGATGQQIQFEVDIPLKQSGLLLTNTTVTVEVPAIGAPALTAGVQAVDIKILGWTLRE